MNKEIGDIGGVKVFVTPEDYEEVKKQDTINRDKILSELQEENDRLNNIISSFEEWLKEHSFVDFNCRDTIIHEQLSLNTAYEYLQELKDEDGNS